MKNFNNETFNNEFFINYGNVQVCMKSSILETLVASTKLSGSLRSTCLSPAKPILVPQIAAV